MKRKIFDPSEIEYIIFSIDYSFFLVWLIYDISSNFMIYFIYQICGYTRLDYLFGNEISIFFL